MASPSIDPDEVPVVDGMPAIGLGTWQNDDPEQCAESVRTALEMGYRHVDTAKAYHNEESVGEGIARADVPREEIFVASKVPTGDLAYDDVIASAERSLRKLDLDTLDLLYVHWPSYAYDPEETLPAFDDLHDRGLIEHVGVSNFTPEHVDRARDVLDAPLFANQVEMHPLLPQRELREHAADRGYNLVAYSPLARGAVLEEPTIVDLAGKHDVGPAVISLAWLRQHGVPAVPKATSEGHIRENLQSVNVTLSEEDVERIDAIDRTERQIDPDFAPDAW